MKFFIYTYLQVIAANKKCKIWVEIPVFLKTLKKTKCFTFEQSGNMRKKSYITFHGFLYMLFFLLFLCYFLYDNRQCFPHLRGYREVHCHNVWGQNLFYTIKELSNTCEKIVRCYGVWRDLSSWLKDSLESFQNLAANLLGTSLASGLKSRL